MEMGSLGVKSSDPDLSERSLEQWDRLVSHEAIAGSGLTGAESRRAKSSLRLRYEAEVEVLKRKIGDLESIRIQLGLSQRKICQLLLVDPSAWTRWTKRGESAPPHIYRSLQWYLALADKYPAQDVNFWLQALARPTNDQALSKVGDLERAEIESLKLNFAALRQEMEARWQSERELKEAQISALRRRLFWITGILMAFAAAAGALVALALGN